MAKYGRKPEVIEAFKWTGQAEQSELPIWLKAAVLNRNIYFIGDSESAYGEIRIKTHLGVMTAQKGYYLIKGEKGEICPCKPDVFEKIYEEIGEISDGYHTFNELYYHRMILFSVICNMNRSKAWKSWKHHDGSMYDDYFIVGIDTPEGRYSYHYHKDYWDIFNVEELENAPEWDGHEPKDINRLISLLQETNKDYESENNEKLNTIIIICDGEEIILNTKSTLEEVAKNICELEAEGDILAGIEDYFHGYSYFFNPKKVSSIKYLKNGIKS